MKKAIILLAVSLTYCLAANIHQVSEDERIAEEEFAKLNNEELEVAKHWKDIIGAKRELARDQKNSEVAQHWEAALEEKELEEYLAAEELQMQKKQVQAGQTCIQGDVIFVLDSSGSIGIDNWKFVLDFTNEAINRLNVGPYTTHVAVETFGNRAHIIFNLNNFTSAAQIAPVVSAAKFLDENTNTSGAIWMAQKVMLSPANGGRPGVPKMIIVITDGESTYDHNLTIPYAQEGKAAGILFISIGVGNQVSVPELDGIASPGGDGKPLVFQVGSYAMLSKIQDTLAAVACDPTATQAPTGITQPPTQPPTKAPAPAPNCDVPQTTTPKDCPGLSCKNRCQYGFAQDSDDCLTCGCLPKPFSEADCASITTVTAG